MLGFFLSYPVGAGFLSKGNVCSPIGIFSLLYISEFRELLFCCFVVFGLTVRESAKASVGKHPVEKKIKEYMRVVIRSSTDVDVHFCVRLSEMEAYSCVFF